MIGDKKAIEELGQRPRVLVAMLPNQGDWHEGVQGHFGGRREKWCNSLKNLSSNRDGGLPSSIVLDLNARNFKFECQHKKCFGSFRGWAMH